MKYLSWKEEKLTDFSSENVARMYNNGFVFTRISKGIMHQTRSVRIDLSKFELTSENRRMLKKTDGLVLEEVVLPMKNYGWEVGKLAKDFYDTKFGSGIMSAQKIKEMLTRESASNFNALLTFHFPEQESIGYAITYSQPEFLHYSYPFYDVAKAPKDMGLGMMTRTIAHAKHSGKKYVYLGSLQRPADTYKLQFEGIEWFDGKAWSEDIEQAKKVLEER